MLHSFCNAFLLTSRSRPIKYRESGIFDISWPRDLPVAEIIKAAALSDKATRSNVEITLLEKYSAYIFSA